MMKKQLILIVGPEAAEGFLSSLARALDAENVEIIRATGQNPLASHARWPEVDILVPFAVPCTGADLKAGKALRAIIVPSLGYEGIDVEAATQRGIIVANGQVTENYETVAEAAIMFTLMALYDIHATEQRLRDRQHRSGPPVARMLRGRTVGIIGLGNIARAVITRLQNWNVRILVHTRSRTADPDPSIEYVDLACLLAASDVVMPLLPLTAETHHLLNRDRLLAMKERAILVNLSRGAIIDEAALADPLVHQRLGGIALDVYETEPLPAGSPLRGLNKAILTPHEISHTAENLTALFNRTVDNVSAMLAGRMPPTAINPDAVPSMPSGQHAIQKV